MLIRVSTFVHLTDLAEDRVLVVHAIHSLRLVIDRQVATIVTWFMTPRDMPGEIGALQAAQDIDPDVLARCLAELMAQGILTDVDPAAEGAEVAARLADLHGRDPGEALDMLRRDRNQGAEPYWSVAKPRGVKGLGQSFGHRWDVLLFGDCELQMEADFLRRAGAGRGVDLRVATAFPDDLRFAQERSHQAILVGALRSRKMVALASDAHLDPWTIYLQEARQIVEGLRSYSTAPILIDNLPEPTVQPLGFADRGPLGHRNRFRRLNLELEQLAAEYVDVHIVDIAAALNAEGSARLLDDGLVGFTHFGSPGWMLQRPKSELAAVHGQFPDPGPLAAELAGHAYGREEVTAHAHMGVLSILMGLDRKKCVIVDLDGLLWPGVLAETGSPFAWSPEISGLYSYVGLFFGLHEALKALKRRGVLLACVSKNDEALVRTLWRYPSDYPLDRLLTPDDFVTMRINWNDKAATIQSIADELGFALDAFVFVDDHPVERERVRQALPKVEVLGDNLFSLRRALLTDPRLQAPSVTQEAATRTTLQRAQIDRDRQRALATDADDFLVSLNVVCAFDQPTGDGPLARVAELFQRTTQFNTTGRIFATGELVDFAAAGAVFTAKASDRLGDYGLVAAAVVADEEIIAFAMSCRVIGLGVEHEFLKNILSVLTVTQSSVKARIIDTARNGPVRHLYEDHGFTQESGFWHRRLPLTDTVQTRALGRTRS